jgi:hypothetical protein
LALVAQVVFLQTEVLVLTLYLATLLLLAVDMVLLIIILVEMVVLVVVELALLQWEEQATRLA